MKKRSPNKIQVVILAGGKGTRLKTISKNMPKPMTKILDKPLLHHQIELCVKQGITDIHLLVGYKSEAIFNYFLDGSSFLSPLRTVFRYTLAS